MSDKERDELMNALAETIGNPYAAGSDLSLFGRLVDCHMHIEGNLDVGNIASDLIADGWTKTRTITTVGELDALPFDSVIRSQCGVIREKLAPGEFRKPPFCWATPGSIGDRADSEHITLPATVLHEPAQ